MAKGNKKNKIDVDQHDKLEQVRRAVRRVRELETMSCDASLKELKHVEFGEESYYEGDISCPLEDGENLFSIAL